MKINEISCKTLGSHQKRRDRGEAVVALAGNPNVGKSTVFNRLTGLHQHTGNWAGKTVSAAEGFFESGGRRYRLADIPGMYSFSPQSAEEEAALEYLCSGSADAIIAVCDAGCLARGVGLALEAAELADNVVLCVNLIDEAERKGISVDTEKLSRMLNMPVVATSAVRNVGIDSLAKSAAAACSGRRGRPCRVIYPGVTGDCVSALADALEKAWRSSGVNPGFKAEFAAVKLLEDDSPALETMAHTEGGKVFGSTEVIKARTDCLARMEEAGLDRDKIRATVAVCRMNLADSVCGKCVAIDRENGRTGLDRRLDRIFTGRVSGRLCMLLMLGAALWITIVGANYPSLWLSQLFGSIGGWLERGMESLAFPVWLRSLLYDGIYRVVAWIVSVMLPPMAIFFPLFTLMEDFGYLPRAAFNMDSGLRRCGACGKQALTMCMGLGCNAVGVTGCRIIDSPRERLIAVVTNSFMPCNGRFPLLIALISMFFVGAGGSSLLGAVMLTGLICLGAAATFAVSRLISATLLKGMPSSFALELPPFRRPRLLEVALRSVLDRTVFVLGRAIVAAVPAGAVIWLAAGTKVGDGTLLSLCCATLDPIGRLLGMDGVILVAFILGMPANELVLPLMLMAYSAQGTLSAPGDTGQICSMLSANGWTAGTAVCVMIFSIMHWPCATTCLTIYKETGSLKWTALSVMLPTLVGTSLCLMAAALMRLW